MNTVEEIVEKCEGNLPLLHTKAAQDKREQLIHNAITAALEALQAESAQRLEWSERYAKEASELQAENAELKRQLDEQPKPL